MKLAIERSALLRSLGHVQSVVERRNTIPILSNILIEAKGGRLSLTATDLDIEVVETIPADVTVDGATTAPAHVFYDIVRKLPDGSQVGLVYDAGTERLEISAGRSRFSLACLPREDFPAMTAADTSHAFRIDVPDLKRMLDKTRFAISTEETRYYLNGIYLHAMGEGDKACLRAVATDGHRLARYETAQPEGAAGMPGVIVPRKTVNEVRKLVDDLDGSVMVRVSDTKIRFACDGMILTSKLIDGTFPDYQRVIPPGNDKHMIVDPKIFIGAVDRVSTISSEKSRAVKMAVDGGKVTLSVQSPDSGSAVEELESDFDGEAMEIGFNARYLLEIAGQIDGEAAVFDLQDAGSPTVIREKDDARALYVLMPMRV